MQVAESIYDHIQLPSIMADSFISEEFADAFYEIGKNEHERKQFESAAHWLERSIEILGEQDVNQLSEYAPDLKLSVMHLFTKSLIAIATPESRSKATNILELMDKEYGDKMLVSLLKLESFATESHPDGDIYHGVLLRLIRSVYLTKDNFKTIMYHLHKLRKINQDIACKCLDEFLEIRLFKTGTAEYIERATLMRIWITTSSNTNITPDELEAFLENIAGNISAPFSTSATFAAQTLIWKTIEVCFSQKQYYPAERLCRLADHRLFEKAGEGNRGKLLRKMMQCALARQDWNQARTYFFSMHGTVQAVPLSRFLLFKVAIRSDDEELGKFRDRGVIAAVADQDAATECLNVIVQNSNKELSVLYACAIEAQQTGHRKLGIQALQSVMEMHKHGDKGIHMPALLRSFTPCVKSVRILKDSRCLLKLSKAEMSKKPIQGYMESVSRIFENGSCPPAPQSFSAH
jgi:hypothetical protein